MAETSKTQEKAKKLCYERRASSIIKKSKELQILCDVKVGVVILSPDGKLESWPPGLKDVKVLLDACKGMPNVRSEKRKSPENSNSKLQLLNQREEFFKRHKSSSKGKDIATTSRVRSKKTKEFREGYPEILNSKLELLNKREMVFFNAEDKEIPSMERIESLCDDIIAAHGQDGRDVLTQNLYDDDDDLGRRLMGDFFFNCNYPQDNGKEIATMENKDSGILQDTAHYGLYQTKLGPYYGFGAHQYDETVRELTSMNCGMGQNQWHHGSNSVNHALQEGSLSCFDASYQPTQLQKSFTALDNGTTKKVSLQNSTDSLNQNLPSTCAEFWQDVLNNSGLQNSSDALNNVPSLVDTVDLCNLQPSKNLL